MDESSCDSNFNESNIISAIAPAQSVSSKLNLSFQPLHNNNTFLFCLINQSLSTFMFKNDPTTIVLASFLATLMVFVPLVVVITMVFPLKAGSI